MPFPGQGTELVISFSPSFPRNDVNQWLRELDNLTATQARCTELLEENRAFRKKVELMQKGGEDVVALNQKLEAELRRFYDAASSPDPTQVRQGVGRAWLSNDAWVAANHPSDGELRKQLHEQSVRIAELTKEVIDGLSAHNKAYSLGYGDAQKKYEAQKTCTDRSNEEIVRLRRVIDEKSAKIDYQNLVLRKIREFASP